MDEPAKSGKPQASTVTAPAAPTDFMSRAKFKRVIFEPKTQDSDTNDVAIGVEGFLVKAQRGIETIVPDFILEAADHTTFVKYSVKPGEGRKVGAKIKRFPYHVTGEATFAEFKALMAAGNKKTREAVATHGLNIPVEKSMSQTEE
jgi:hypothetical protein